MTFGRPTIAQRQALRAAERARNLEGLCTPSRSLHRGSYAGETGAAAPKDNPLRSEAYRRLVAALPCWSCSAPPPSQAAHANTGKGMGLKTDDRSCFPLCPSCHRHLDQGGMDRDMRREVEERAGIDTRAAIRAAGNWPKNLTKWEES